MSGGPKRSCHKVDGVVFQQSICFVACLSAATRLKAALLCFECFMLTRYVFGDRDQLRRANTSSLAYPLHQIIPKLVCKYSAKMCV